MVNAYVFDTSALIGAWVRSYPPENFPNFWDNLDDMAQQGRILVPEEVYKELEAKQDELLEWVQDRAEWLLAPTTRPGQQTLHLHGAVSDRLVHRKGAHRSQPTAQ